MKRPAFQFYPADWRKDVELQACSLAAQGLWINAMCIAHECEPYGHLTINGRPMTVAQLARQVGVSVREATGLIAELRAAGVVSEAPDGALFSRRMVRDEVLRAQRAEAGKAGAEHGHKGAEHGRKGGRPRKPKGAENPPRENPEGGFEGVSETGRKPPPSSSTSVSPPTEEREERADNPPSPTRGRRLPEQFPSEVELAWCRQKRPELDAVRVAEVFRDYHTAHGSTMKDWPAAWRMWVGKERITPGSRTPTAAARGDSFLDALDAIGGITTESSDDHEPGPARLGR